jgi:four helix bundle protein
MKDEKSQPQDLKLRASDFALWIIRLDVALPKTTQAQVLGKQVLRSGTSVGAQYREGHRAKSDADVITKFEGVLQELFGLIYSSSLIAFQQRN